MSDDQGPSRDAAVTPISIGKWTLHPGSHRLTCGSDTRQLEPKELGVLLHLAECAPNVVPTDALLDRTWHGTVVGDNALHRVIARLRHALGDDTRHPTYIETLRHSGYRLIAPVAMGAATGASSEQSTAERSGRVSSSALGLVALVAAVALLVLFRNWSAPDSVVISIPAPDPPEAVSDLAGARRIAIYTLKDGSADQSLGWLAEGIPQHIRHLLENSANARIEPLPGGLLKDGPELGAQADMALSGRVSKVNNAVSVAVELSDVPNSQLWWTQTFTAESDDPSELQQEIAAAIARYVVWSLSAFDGWGPKAPDARVPFLKYLHLAALGGAIDDEVYWLRRTLERDQSWLPGWESLARWLPIVASLERDPAFIDDAWHAVEQARRVADPDHPDVAVDAVAYLEGYWRDDPPTTERVLREKRWDRFYVQVMRDAGLYAEAERYFRYYVEEVAPYEAFGWYELATARVGLHDSQGAIDAVRMCTRLSPPASFNCSWPLIWALPVAGRFAEGEALRERIAARIAKLPPGSLAARQYQGLIVPLNFYLAFARGDAVAARAALTDAYEKSPFADNGMASMLIQLDDPRADGYLRSAIENARYLRPHWSGIEPYFTDKHRKHPLHAEYVQAVGFTPE